MDGAAAKNVNIRLTTERLTLEPLSERHAAAFLAYHERNRAHLKQWEPARPESFYTLETQQSETLACEADAQRGVLERFVAFADGGADIVASINLWNIRRGSIHAAIIGYSVDARYEGQGYATEAAGAVVRYAFEELNLHRLETSYQPANERSGRVLRKLGFVVEGYARDYLFLNGAWRDGILVSLTNPDWRAL
jgi:ribosomal-protein-alanine N-acetyltransferase